MLVGFKCRSVLYFSLKKRDESIFSLEKFPLSEIFFYFIYLPPLFSLYRGHINI